MFLFCIFIDSKIRVELFLAMNLGFYVISLCLWFVTWVFSLRTVSIAIDLGFFFYSSCIIYCSIALYCMVRYMNNHVFISGLPNKIKKTTSEMRPW
jgi:hypothetical protein